MEMARQHLVPLADGSSGYVKFKYMDTTGIRLVPVFDGTIPAACGNLGWLYGVPCCTDTHLVVRLQFPEGKGGITSTNCPERSPESCYTVHVVWCSVISGNRTS